MFTSNRSAPDTTYLARPVQVGQHSIAADSRTPPPPPILPPPQSRIKTKPIPQKAEVRPIFDRDKLLSEVRSGVQLRHTVTNDKSAPIGVGRVRSGGYSPPPDTVASTSSTYSSRPDAKKPVFYGQRNNDDETAGLAPAPPPPPKTPPPAALLKLGGSSNFDRDKLLSEIHGGVKLRKAVTNDRSAPIGVGIVRDDLSPSPSPSPSPIPETFFASTSQSGNSTAPPVPPPPSPNFLSPQMQHHKPAKPITNPALLKLGGKQPVDRDALLASIRSGVKLRKVETNDRTSPFSASRETSPHRAVPLEPAVAPPPPPLLVPPPPPAASAADPLRRSRSPKPALAKLGGKVTVDRDELMRSIRQGVKLRKVVTNDKSSALINDDDSGVKSPGRSSPSTTSNYEDDVYGSQSLSDLSSTGTSRFSSLSNIPPEASAVTEVGIKATPSAPNSSSVSPKKQPSIRPQLINVSIDFENCNDENNDDEVENETGTLKVGSSQKIKADERYSSPIPTREQIEAEIPAGSARDRIRMFGGAAREASNSPTRSLSRTKIQESETDGSEFGVARVRKIFNNDTTPEKLLTQASGHRNEERERAAAKGSGESSIRKMVRKFSTDDDTSKTSQPIWCQKREGEVTNAESERKTANVKRKTSGTKSSLRKKSSTKETAVRRKSSTKNVAAVASTPAVNSMKSRTVPLKSKEVVPELPQEVKEEPKERKNSSRWTPPKVDISKFRERFENFPVTEQSATMRRSSTSEEITKPGRIKKPPWIKDEESVVPPLPPASTVPVSRKTEEATHPTWKKTKAPELPADESEKILKSTKTTVPKSVLKKKESSDHEESPEAAELQTPATTTSSTSKKTLAVGLKSTKPAETAEQTAEVPTREGVGPYRYARKGSTIDKKSKKDSVGSKKSANLGGGSLLNSVPKPLGTQFSTTGHTTTIGAEDVQEEPKVAAASASRHFVFKPNTQSTNTKASDLREREEAFGEQTRTKRTNKTTAEVTTDDVHYANIGVAVTRIYAVPITTISCYHSDINLSSSSSASSTSSLSSSTYQLGNNITDHFGINGGSIQRRNAAAGNNHFSPVTGREYPENLWKQYRSQPQQQLLPLRRDWDGAIGRAHRVIVGETRTQMTFRSGFQQRSFDGNDPIESQLEDQEREHHQYFHQNYRFEIDVDNNQQPVKIVPR